MGLLFALSWNHFGHPSGSKCGPRNWYQKTDEFGPPFGTLLEVQLGALSSKIRRRCSLGHPKPPNRTPRPTQSASRSPKRGQMSTTRHQTATNHKKSSWKHAPEQRRTMTNKGFPLVLCISLKAHGIWHLAHCHRNLVVSIMP